MNSPLRVLHLEDDVRDTELVQAALEAEGIPIDLTRVETEQDFVSTLNRGSSDLILADYTLPSFDGLSALRIAQQQLPNVPFLFVSGTLGEDVAIEALKTGATDYILKTRLSRLGPAVTRALREARERTERQRAEAAVRASEQVARGQVDALMQSLDVLATAPAPDKFLGQMLLSIGRQLQAARVLLWLRSHEDEKLRLRLAMEGEKQVPEDPEHPFAKDPYAWKTIGFWQEMLFTGGPIVCEEIEQDTRLGEEMREYLIRKGTRKFLIVPVLVTGEVRGFIGIHHPARDPYRAEEIELAQALAHQVMLAIQLTQLAEQGRHAAILEERTRMARDIHDTLAQGFTGVIVQMEAAEDALGDQDREEAVRHIRRARQLARESLGEARRSVHALRSQALEKAGFWDALRGIIRNTTLGTPLQTGFRLEGDVRELAPHVEENLLHIGQEALTNALKHAQATRFETRLAFEPNAVCLELCDNGNGFVANGANGGFGLIGMRERVEQIGGTLTVTSARGEGTTIVAIAPYQEKGKT